MCGMLYEYGHNIRPTLVPVLKYEHTTVLSQHYHKMIPMLMAIVEIWLYQHFIVTLSQHCANVSSQQWNLNKLRPCDVSTILYQRWAPTMKSDKATTVSRRYDNVVPMLIPNVENWPCGNVASMMYHVRHQPTYNIVTMLVSNVTIQTTTMFLQHCTKHWSMTKLQGSDIIHGRLLTRATEAWKFDLGMLSIRICNMN